MFTQEDELLLAKRGITEAHVMDQLECFKKGDIAFNSSIHRFRFEGWNRYCIDVYNFS